MKRLDQKGFTHHLMMLVMAVLVVGVVGFAGWRVIKKNIGINAKAETPVFTGNAGEFLPVSPQRILDTRNGTGGFNVALAGQSEIDLTVSGQGGLPVDNINAVVASVTAVSPAAAGYLTIYPSGYAKPNASAINFVSGQNIINTVTIKVGSNGKLKIFNGSTGAVHLTVDVLGYYTTENGPNGLRYTQGGSDRRVLDTRVGIGATKAKVLPQQEIVLSMNFDATTAARGVEAVEANLQVIDPLSKGYLTAYPDGETRPNISSLNFMPNQSIANATIVKMGSNGKIKIFNGSSSPVDIVIDMAGIFYYRSVSNSLTDGKFAAINPVRIVDTRDGTGVTAGIFKNLQFFYKINVVDGMPPYVRAALVNATVVKAENPGYINMYKDNYNFSTINYVKGQTIANMTSVPVFSDKGVVTKGLSKVNGVNVTSGSAHILVDLYGYYSL